MKTIKTALMATAILVSSQFTNAQVQGNLAGDNYKNPKVKMSNQNYYSPSESKTTNANEKALANFNQSYANAQNVTWSYEATGEPIASFTVNKVKQNVFYNKKGKYIGTVKLYGSKQMSASLLEMVWNNYPRYNIEGVTEVETNGKTGYLVYLSKGNNIKHIKIAEGEIELVKEFNDGKIVFDLYEN